MQIATQTPSKHSTGIPKDHPCIVSLWQQQVTHVWLLVDMASEPVNEAFKIIGFAMPLDGCWQRRAFQGCVFAAHLYQIQVSALFCVGKEIRCLCKFHGNVFVCQFRAEVMVATWLKGLVQW